MKRFEVDNLVAEISDVFLFEGFSKEALPFTNPQINELIVNFIIEMEINRLPKGLTEETIILIRQSIRQNLSSYVL